MKTQSDLRILSLFLLLVVGFAVIQSCTKEDPTPPASAEKTITALSFDGVVQGASVDIKGTNITVTVPYGTDITALAPTITLPKGATISPASGVKQNFTKPVTYTVTAEDGTKQTFIVTVTQGPAPKSSAKEIKSFVFKSFTPAIVATIDSAAKTITATLPTTADLTKLAPEVTLSAKATVSPASGAAQDFSKPVNYTVTAEDGTTQKYEVAVSKKNISSISNAIDISAGHFYSMVLTEKHELWACGDRFDGQLGDGLIGDPLTDVYELKKIIGNVRAIEAGFEHSFIIKDDNSLWGTGKNYFGALGNGTRTDVGTYLKIMDNVKAVSAGHNFTLVLKNDNTLWVTGDMSYGKLGNGIIGENFQIQSSFIKIADNVIAVSAGFAHTMVLKSDKTLWVCGANFAGQLGDGTIENRAILTKVLEDVIAISAGAKHSLVIKSDNSLWACGSNDYAQLGNSSVRNRLVYSKTADNVIKISAGDEFSLIIKKDNSLWTCGQNFTGELGYESNARVHELKKVEEGVREISGGSYSFSLIIKDDNRAYSSGDNSSGQLSVGSQVYEQKVFKNMLYQ